MRRSKPVPLSTFLSDKTPIPKKKLSLVGKNITIIDEVNPYMASQIHSLDLQNNKITSLKGIQQFTELRQLNISQNKLQNGEQLNKLRDLYQLKRLYLSNNPFLNQPLNQSILDFILDKQTDIQILSYQVLSTLKDVQQKQIKIIFLKNYIKKIDMHEELKRKNMIERQNGPAQTEQILSKIVPQFYTLIQDPKIIQKIKRQAIDKKKKTQQTIQQALQGTKQQKDEKIDQLVKNIVNILHNNEQFKKSRSFFLEVNLNDNTITFSPQKKLDLQDPSLLLASHQYSPVKYIEASKDDGSIEDITLTNTKQFGATGPQTNIKDFESKKSQYESPYRKNKFQFEDEKKDGEQTVRKPTGIKTISEKIKQHSQFKQSYQSKIKKIKQKEQENIKITESKLVQVKQSPKRNFSLNKFKKANNYGDPIKVIEQFQDEQNKNSMQQKKHSNQNEQTFKANHFSNISYMNSSALHQNLTPQNIQNIYIKNLSKVNPLFSLLYSPSDSLSHQQKTQLLEALKLHHKQKFMELMKQKINNQQLIRQNQQLKTAHSREIQNIINSNKNVYNQYLAYKEQFQWIDQRQRATQQKYDELADLLKQTEASDRKKATALNIVQNNYKKMKQAYGEKLQRVNFLEDAEDKQEIIRQRRDNYVLKKYLEKLNKLGTLWGKVFVKNKQNKIKRNRQLLMWGMESFLFNKIQEEQIRSQIKKNELQITKDKFYEWKIYKQLQKKQKKSIKYVFKTRSLEFWNLMKRNEANCKMRKLKNIWAQRFHRQKAYKSSIKKWIILRQLLYEKTKKSQRFYENFRFKNIFTVLRQIVKTRKQNIERIYEQRSNRLIQQQFKRMIYIMKKQALQIDDCYVRTLKSIDNLKKRSYFNDFLAHTKNKNHLKKRQISLKKYLKQKNFKVLYKLFLRSNKKIKKLNAFCRKLNFGVTIRMIRRQKQSNDYSTILLKRRWIQFFKNLRENRHKQSHFRKNSDKLKIILQSKLTFSKLNFIKRLQILKLKGKNYIKKRKLEEMNHQMDLNDLNTIDLIKAEKQALSKCEKEILFLKSQIQNQSIRQMSIMREKDELLMSIGQSYQIMMQLRRQIESIRHQYLEQQDKYNELVNLYNQSIQALQKKQKQYERLYETLENLNIK